MTNHRARQVAVVTGGGSRIGRATCDALLASRLGQPELRDIVESKIPLGQVAQPEEIAEAIAVLASGRMAYLTGAALNIDGGWTAL